MLAVEFGLNPDFCHVLLAATSAQSVGGRLEPGWGGFIYQIKGI